MRDFLKNLKLNEQNISMLLGVIVVILVGSLLYNYFKSVNKPKTGQTSSTATPEQKAEVPSGDKLPAEYVVQKGDTLWSISMQAYGSGYNWSDVYAANKQVIGKNPNRLLADSKIQLPKVEAKVVATPATTSSEKTEYTVVKGDHLWGILVKACNNGYLWSKVAKENNLANANRIEVGQKLTFTCN